MSSSSHALANSVFGTDALSIPKLYDVSGWVAVVTGGGTGLGLTTAAALAQNGAKVYITGRRLEPLIEARDKASPKDGRGSIVPVQADVSTKEGILKLRAEVEKNEQWINLLVNNHGVSLTPPNIDGVEQTPEALSEEMFNNESFDSWADTYRINVSSYYFTASAFLPLLAKAQTLGGAPEPGNIINIASISGICLTSQRGQFSYNSSKAATRQLTQMLSTELTRRGVLVRVNAISPGYFPSGMSVKEYSDALGEEHYKRQYGIPFGRPGTARDYAQCILALACNQYQTGSEIVIDGGWLRTQAF